jgi:hypothetical protein
MDEPLAELAAFSCSWYEVPDADLVRLTAAARAAGHRWDAIAAACGNGSGVDIPAVIGQQYWVSPAVGPGPLFSATQRAARKLTGRDAGCYPPLAWLCPGCGQRVTDLAPGGRRFTPSWATRRAAPGWPAIRPPMTRCAGIGCPG